MVRSALLALLVAVPAVAADPPAPVGRKITDFTLLDPASNKPWTLVEQTRDAKATVIAFLATGCPVSNAYTQRLAEYARKFGPKGVVFVGVNSHPADSAADTAAHTKLHALPFPVLKDDGTTVADKFAVDRVPCVVLLDAGRAVRYAGRIDDQFAPGVQRSSPTTRELSDALYAVLDNQPVKTTHAPAAGCKLTRATAPAATTTVTYHKQVSRIIQARCQECHRPGEAGPFPLVTYKQAKSWAGMMKEVVTDGLMPPWSADAPFGHFKNERRLSPEQKKDLLAWIDAGCPEGDPADAPAAVKYTDGWRLPKQPDLVLTMNRPVLVPAHGLPVVGMPYQYVLAGEPFAEDTWVEAVEVRPQYREAVHHILAFLLPPDVDVNDFGQVARALGGRNFGGILIGSYVPGDQPMIAPPGTARKVPKGSRVLFEVHYTPNGRPGTDRSMIGLVKAKGVPERELVMRSVPNNQFLIPPGAHDFETKSYHVFDRSAQIIALAPHMHLRGKAFRFDLTYLNGTTGTPLNVPKYDFNWQLTYEMKDPLIVPSGTLLTCTAKYDNSTANPFNPDPTKAIRWGNQTWDEMMIGFVVYTELPRRPLNPLLVPSPKQ